MSRQFASALLFAVSANAQSSLYRQGSSSENYLISTAASTTDTVKWKITAQTWLNEDTGAQQVRITHDLTANILQTDTVLFELAFIPAS
jgi:hypothetical protein